VARLLKKKRGKAFEEEEGLHGVHRQLRRNEHPKTKEGCKKFSGKQGKAFEEEKGLHGVHRQLRRNEHPKTKECCKKCSGKQAVTHRRPTPRKLLYARHDTWLCRQNRQSHHTQCRIGWDT
jgi:hypothetical protein